MSNKYPTIKCVAINIHIQYSYHLKNQKMEENKLKINTKIGFTRTLSKKSPHKWNHLTSSMHNFSSNPNCLPIFKNFSSFGKIGRVSFKKKKNPKYQN